MRRSADDLSVWQAGEDCKERHARYCRYRLLCRPIPMAERAESDEQSKNFACEQSGFEEGLSGNVISPRIPREGLLPCPDGESDLSQSCAFGLISGEAVPDGSVGPNGPEEYALNRAVRAAAAPDNGEDGLFLRASSAPKDSMLPRASSAPGDPASCSSTGISAADRCFFLRASSGPEDPGPNHMLSSVKDADGRGAANQIRMTSSRSLNKGVTVFRQQAGLPRMVRKIAREETTGSNHSQQLDGSVREESDDGKTGDEEQVDEKSTDNNDEDSRQDDDDNLAKEPGQVRGIPILHLHLSWTRVKSRNFVANDLHDTCVKVSI